jgi:hypothetical protein
MPSTYEPIATTTVAIPAGTITFSSIASTYTDLRVVITLTTALAGSNVFLRFNSDTGSNYSYTRLIGDGSAASSDRNTGANRIQVDLNTSATVPLFESFDIFSYAGSTNKTVLATSSEDLNGSGAVSRAVGLWRNTAAITAVSLTSAYNFSIGTTATLYGIKNA